MHFKKIPLTFFLLLNFIASYSQLPDTINEKNVKEILTWLASDELKGRVNFTNELKIAGTFIADKFREYGLSPFQEYPYYYQPFAIKGGRHSVKEDLKWNGKKLASYKYLNLTTSLVDPNTVLADYKVIHAGGSLPDSILFHNWNDTSKVLIWVKKELKEEDQLIPGTVIIPETPPTKEILVVAAPDEPLEISLTANLKYSNDVLYNVIGVLPGRSKPGEIIIFSAHYDHIASNAQGQTGLFNGANDNASGITAVLELARYFSMRKDNERTIIFCLFAGEELGLLGSTAFVKDAITANVKAVINIEMIGATNRTGKKAFFITGSWRSDLEKIMKKNLKEDKVKIDKEGSEESGLFERSDNYPFYEAGIPAHTIMCSDDNEPCYHQTCDDTKRIDFENLALIIKAIAKSCQTIISGEDTPKKR